MAQDALPELPAPEKTQVLIGLSVTEPSQFAVQAANAAGFFQDLGMDPLIAVFEGDGKVLQALQAGQLDVGFVGVSAALNSQVTDAPVKILSTNATILSDNLISQPDITTADDLRGQCVAVSTYGGTSHGAVLLSLAALGLTPEDVVIQEIGGQSARIAALEGGSCAAAPVDVNLEQQMVEEGFNVLVNLKTSGTEWGRSGLGVTQEWLDANPNTALNILQATLRGQDLFWSDPDLQTELYADFTDFDEETARAIVEDFQTVGNHSMIWTEQAFEIPQQVIGTVNPPVLDHPVSDAYDRSFIQQLIDNGTYEALGIEVPDVS
jgi:NitT/TauT family transport system substrate-binding protein